MEKCLATMQESADAIKVSELAYQASIEKITRIDQDILDIKASISSVLEAVNHHISGDGGEHDKISSDHRLFLFSMGGIILSIISAFVK